MALELRWVGESEIERVAEARLRSYAGSAREIGPYREEMESGLLSRPGDWLLAELDGRPVGTTTSRSMAMWIRGHRVPCQGVAWVGTSKTVRRRRFAPATPAAPAGKESGIATQLMWETIRKAREREEIVSALMPFRASYYEHFGYGIAERRCAWTIPLSILPQADTKGLRFYEPADDAERRACRQRVAEAGQCDIERWDGMWAVHAKRSLDALDIVDRPDDAGPVRGWMTFGRVTENGRDWVKVIDHGHENLAALCRQLAFLGSMKDQFWGGQITLPADIPLNRLLAETQIPHRPVSHATAEVRLFTRMQLRVLDHRKLLAGMRLPVDARGAVRLNIHETEGDVSKLHLEIEGGRIALGSAPTDAGHDFTCTDKTWAAIVSGDLRATDAVRWELATASSPAAVRIMDAFGEGKAPFCLEHF